PPLSTSLFLSSSTSRSPPPAVWVSCKGLTVPWCVLSSDVSVVLSACCLFLFRCLIKPHPLASLHDARAHTHTHTHTHPHTHTHTHTYTHTQTQTHTHIHTHTDTHTHTHKH